MNHMVDKKKTEKPIKQAIEGIKSESEKIQCNLGKINHVADKAREFSQSSVWDWLKGLKT